MGVAVLAPHGATAPRGDSAPGDAAEPGGAAAPGDATAPGDAAEPGDAAAPGGVELARATPSSDALSLAEGQRLVVAGRPVHGPVPEAGRSISRSRPDAEVGVPVGVS